MPSEFSRPLSKLKSNLRLRHVLTRQRLGSLLLLAMCMIWGSTFPALKLLTVQLSALDITLLRYGGAGLLLLPWLRGVRPAEWRWGGLLGLVLFLAFWLQTEGIARTSANRNAFITGLNVLAVPLLATLLGQRPGWRLLCACVLAAYGMWLLFYQQAPWNTGDSLTLVAMGAYALYIVLLEVSARRHAAQPLRILPLTALQGLCMGVCALGLMLLQGQGAAALGRWGNLSGEQWALLLYLLLFASVLAPALQIWAQRYVSAVRSALIYGLEPVFAAVAAYFWIGERLVGSALWGAGILLLALLWGQLPAAVPVGRQADEAQEP